MNTYSSIGGQRTTLRRRVLGKSFRRGLREGVGAPALFFVPFSFTRTEAVDASLVQAWRAVGEALSASSRKRASEIGQATREAESD